MKSVAKSRKHKSRSDTVKTPHFVQQAQDIIDEDPSKFIKAKSRDLQISECTVLRIVHEDVMCKGQFMSAETLLLPIKP